VRLDSSHRHQKKRVLIDFILIVEDQESNPVSEIVESDEIRAGDILHDDTTIK